MRYTVSLLGVVLLFACDDRQPESHDTPVPKVVVSKSQVELTDEQIVEQARLNEEHKRSEEARKLREAIEAEELKKAQEDFESAMRMFETINKFLDD